MNNQNNETQGYEPTAEKFSAGEISAAPEASVAAPKSFDQLIPDKILVERLRELNFSAPTPVQAEAIPLAFDGVDLVIQAATGSGKTFAFGLPLIGKLRNCKAKPGCPSAIVVAPTRELADQICSVLKTLDSEVTTVLLIGGESIERQTRDLERGCLVAVGTPGRILDHLRRRNLHLKDCGFFVLDEADEMLSMGFLEDVRTILMRLPRKRQGILVSATMPARVDLLARSFLSNAERVKIEGLDSKPDIEHQFISVPPGLTSKPPLVCDLLEAYQPRSAIVFCNTKAEVDILEAMLRRRGVHAKKLHSELSQPARKNILNELRSGELRVLVATDIAARGLDIDHIDLVINYSIHDEAEAYVHRTGRTGRAGRSGRAVSLIAPQDFVPFVAVRKALGVEFVEVTPPSDRDVATGRIAAVSELIRSIEETPDVRDQECARVILKDLGDIENPNDEIVDFLSLLCAHLRAERVRIRSEELNRDSELSQERAREGQQSRGSNQGRFDRGRNDRRGRR